MNRARTLQFSISAHTSRLWLYDAAGVPLGINLPLDVRRGVGLGPSSESALCGLIRFITYIKSKRKNKKQIKI
jgi:hypothetical protein